MSAVQGSENKWSCDQVLRQNVFWQEDSQVTVGFQKSLLMCSSTKDLLWDVPTLNSSPLFEVLQYNINAPAHSEQENQIYLMLWYELSQLHSCFTCSPLASVIGPTIFTARIWEATSASTSVSAASPHPRSPWDLSTNPGPVWPPAIRAPAASKGRVD